MTVCTVYTYIKWGAAPLHKYLVGYYSVGPAQMSSEQQYPHDTRNGGLHPRKYGIHTRSYRDQGGRAI